MTSFADESASYVPMPESTVVPAPDTPRKGSNPSAPPRKTLSSPRVGEEEGRFDLSCLAFVDDLNFQYFIGAVICANIFVLAGETDHEEWPVWWYCDNVFLVIFVLELVLKLAYRGLVEFVCGEEWSWSMIDMVIVALGISELWVPLIMSASGQAHVQAHRDPEKQASQPSSGSSFIRFLRLLRLLRIARFFKMFKRLMNLLRAFREMFSSFVLIFSILFFTLFSCAIVCTHLLGHAEGLPRSKEGLEDLYEHIHESFPDITTSVFTLFQITTTDNWVRIAEPVIVLNPTWQIFFIVFICFSSWTMISVLTAVASDSMVMATVERGEQEMREQEEKRRIFIAWLRDKFVEGDVNGDGKLDKDEFVEMAQKPTTINFLRELAISSLTPEYLLKAWELLDHEQTGELTIDEFVVGLSSLSEELSTKHIVSVDSTLKKVAMNAGDEVSRLKGKITEMKRHNADLLERLQMQEQMHQQQRLSLWLWQQWALSKSPGCLPEEVTKRVEVPQHAEK